MTERQAEIMRKILSASTASDSGTAAWVREYAAIEVAESTRPSLRARIAGFLKRGAR